MTRSETKIVHITTVHPPFDVRIFYKQCRSLASKGYKVWLIANHDHDEVIDGVRIKALKRPTSRLTRMLFSGFTAFRKALKINADIYHLHDPELIPFGFLLCLLGKKVVFDMHENIRKSILTKPWIPKSLKSTISNLVYLAERALLGRTHVIFAESSYQKYFPFLKSTETVLNYPRLDDLKDLREEKHPRFTLSYLGNISSDRGLIVTLEALAILEQKGYPCDFDCIGPVPQSMNTKIDSLLGEIKQQQVRFHGFLPSKACYPILAKTHVGLSVLNPAPNYVESIPTKMFEYMALGLPVIVSDFPVLKEIITQYGGGFCIPPSNPNILVDTIIKLIDDPDLYKQLSEQGREAALTHYSWQSQFEKLDLFYQKILTT